MPLTALARQPDPASAPKPVKDRPVSKRVRQAIAVLMSGEARTQKAAAKLVNLSPEHLSRQLAADHVQAFIARESRKNIARGQLRASARIVELLDASSEHVSLDASKHILAIEGIRPPETGTNISIINNVTPGYVLDLRGDERPPLIQHQAQTALNPLKSNDVVQGDE